MSLFFDPHDSHEDVTKMTVNEYSSKTGEKNIQDVIAPFFNLTETNKNLRKVVYDAQQQIMSNHPEISKGRAFITALKNTKITANEISEEIKKKILQNYQTNKKCGKKKYDENKPEVELYTVVYLMGKCVNENSRDRARGARYTRERHVADEDLISWHDKNLTVQQRRKKYFNRFKLVLSFVESMYGDIKNDLRVVLKDGTKIDLQKALAIDEPANYKKMNLKSYTVSKVVYDNTTLVEDVGTVSLQSDADVTCVVRDKKDVSKFDKAIGELSGVVKWWQNKVCLSWSYDLNFYMKSADVENPKYNSEEFENCKTFLRAKLFRHGFLQLESENDTSSFALPYKNYSLAQARMMEARMMNKADKTAYINLWSNELNLYKRMCEERMKRFQPETAIEESYYEFFKIEGYVLTSTLRVVLAEKPVNLDDFSETDLKAAFLENMVDAVIHMRQNTVYKKTKYLKRICNALKLLRLLTCENKSIYSELHKTLIEMAEKAQVLHEKSRKGDDDDTSKDEALRLVCKAVGIIRCVYNLSPQTSLQPLQPLAEMKELVKELVKPDTDMKNVCISACDKARS